MNIDLYDLSDEEKWIAHYTSDHIPRVTDIVSIDVSSQYEVIRVYHGINEGEHSTTVLIVKEIVHV